MMKHVRISTNLVLIVFLFSFGKIAYSSSMLNSVEYHGRLFISKEWIDYSLRIEYLDDLGHEITAFDFLLGGNKIEIPDTAFSNLKQVNSVEPPRPNVANNGQIRIRIFGGDGAKSYQVDMITSDRKFIEMDWRKKGE